MDAFILWLETLELHQSGILGAEEHLMDATSEKQNLRLSQALIRQRELHAGVKQLVLTVRNCQRDANDMGCFGSEYHAGVTNRAVPDDDEQDGTISQVNDEEEEEPEGYPESPRNATGAMPALIEKARALSSEWQGASQSVHDVLERAARMIHSQKKMLTQECLQARKQSHDQTTRLDLLRKEQRDYLTKTARSLALTEQGMRTSSEIQSTINRLVPHLEHVNDSLRRNEEQLLNVTTLATKLQVLPPAMAQLGALTVQWNKLTDLRNNLVQEQRRRHDAFMQDYQTTTDRLRTSTRNYVSETIAKADTDLMQLESQQWEMFVKAWKANYPRIHSLEEHLYQYHTEYMSYGVTSNLVTRELDELGKLIQTSSSLFVLHAQQIRTKLALAHLRQAWRYAMMLVEGKQLPKNAVA